jgi:ribosomal protein S18 acetylase RimI-like enzyme
MSVDDVVLRTARRGDVPSLVLLWVAMLEENARLDPRLAPHPDAREHMARALASRIADPSWVVVVAEEARRLVVGFAAGALSDESALRGPSRSAQLTDCFVAPSRRRRGFARRLVSRVHDALAERGAESVRLTVAASNAGAQAFWASLGYEPLEEVLERPADAAGEPVAGAASAG